MLQSEADSAGCTGSICCPLLTEHTQTRNKDSEHSRTSSVDFSAAFWPLPGVAAEGAAAAGAMPCRCKISKTFHHVQCVSNSVSVAPGNVFRKAPRGPDGRPPQPARLSTDTHMSNIACHVQKHGNKGLDHWCFRPHDLVFELRRC